MKTMPVGRHPTGRPELAQHLSTTCATETALGVLHRAHEVSEEAASRLRQQYRPW